MPEIPQELIDEVTEAHDSIDAYILAVRSEVENYIRLLIRDFKNAESEEEALAILAGFSFSVLPNQLRERVASLRQIYTRQQRVLSRRLDITEADRELKRQYANGEVDSVRFELEAGLNRASSTLALSIASADRVLVNDDELFEDTANGRLNNIAAAVVTGLAAFRSTMNIRKARAGARFLYVGPRDEKNRPFCADILARDRVWTLTEINGLDSHPDTTRLPVRIYAGGWNCRHEWIEQR